MIAQEVPPGKVFTASWGLDRKPLYFLKLREQLAVNLSTFSCFYLNRENQLTEVTVVGELELKK